MDIKSRPPLFLTAGKCVHFYFSLEKKKKKKKNEAKFECCMTIIVMSPQVFLATKLLTAIFDMLKNMIANSFRKAVINVPFPGFSCHGIVLPGTEDASQKSVAYAILYDLYHQLISQTMYTILNFLKIKFMTTWIVVYFMSVNNWTASSEFVTYRLCEQRRFRRACASAQSR